MFWPYFDKNVFEKKSREQPLDPLVRYGFELGASFTWRGGGGCANVLPETVIVLKLYNNNYWYKIA